MASVYTEPRSVYTPCDSNTYDRDTFHLRGQCHHRMQLKSSTQTIYVVFLLRPLRQVHVLVTKSQKGDTRQYISL
jgi:hypothetical protein